jgi:cytochrome c biogenesis protein CcmG/thiol:disulfide interchange protein DsbE
LLAKEVIGSYGDQVQFVSEDWGSSSLAERFGIKRYPVVFVNDVLLARPEDFGWFGAKGRYTPWLEAGNHEKFKKDLAHIIELELRGDTEGARLSGSSTTQAAELEALPELKLQDLQGRSLDTAALDGKVLIVEFWATWCLPCHSTLPWLGELKRLYGDKIEILAVAVESEEADVRKLVGPMKLPYHVASGGAQVATAFGDITSVPTMFIFDRSGKTSAVFYGAPNDLHDKVGRKLDSLLGGK